MTYTSQHTPPWRSAYRWFVRLPSGRYAIASASLTIGFFGSITLAMWRFAPDQMAPLGESGLLILVGLGLGVMWATIREGPDGKGSF